MVLSDSEITQFRHQIDTRVRLEIQLYALSVTVAVALLLAIGGFFFIKIEQIPQRVRKSLPALAFVPMFLTLSVHYVIAGLRVELMMFGAFIRAYAQNEYERQLDRCRQGRPSGYFESLSPMVVTVWATLLSGVLVSIAGNLAVALELPSEPQWERWRIASVALQPSVVFILLILTFIWARWFLTIPIRKHSEIVATPKALRNQGA